MLSADIVKLSARKQLFVKLGGSHMLKTRKNRRIEIHIWFVLSITDLTKNPNCTYGPHCPKIFAYPNCCRISGRSYSRTKLKTLWGTITKCSNNNRAPTDAMRPLRFRYAREEGGGAMHFIIWQIGGRGVWLMWMQPSVAGVFLVSLAFNCDFVLFCGAFEMICWFLLCQQRRVRTSMSYESVSVCAFAWDRGSNPTEK